MKRTLPPLLILANRGRLVAYRRTEAGSLQTVDLYEPAEGNQSPAEIATDQAGAFPSDGSGTSAYESLPLVQELESRSEKKIAARIEAVLKAENPPFWGFAASPESGGAFLGKLSGESLSRLRLHLKVDLTKAPRDRVLARFEEESDALALHR